MTPHVCFGVKPEQPRVCNVFLRSQTKSNRRVDSPQRQYETRLSQWRRDFPVSDVVGLGAHVGVRRFSAMLLPRGAVGAVFGKRSSDVVALDETVMTARVSVVARLFLVAKLVCHTKHVKYYHSLSTLAHCMLQINRVKQASHWYEFCSRDVQKYGVPSRDILVARSLSRRQGDA